MRHACATAVATAALLSAALLSGASTLALAAQADNSSPQAPPAAASSLTGRWKLTMEGQNRTFERELVLTQTGETVSGVLKAPANLPADAAGSRFARDVTFENGTFRDNTLTFTNTFTRSSGESVTITYKATLRNGVLEGETQFGTRSMKWRAVRIGGAGSDIAGEWELETTGQQGPRRSRVILRREGDRLVGEYRRSGGQGRGGAAGDAAAASAANARPRSTPLKDVVLKDGTLSFVVETTRNGNTFTRSFSGKLEGDIIRGEVKTQRGTSPFTARRAGVTPVGEWVLTITTPDRTYTPTVALRRTDTGLSGDLLIDGTNRTPLKEVSLQGSTLRFAVEIPRDDGDPLRVQFSATVEGDTMKGEARSSFGPASFTGKRKAPAPTGGLTER